MENKSNNMEENILFEQNLEFTEVEKFNSVSIIPMTHLFNNLNNKKTKIILKPKSDYKVIQNFSVLLDISEVIDWRLNILEVNISEKYIIVASGKKVLLIPFNYGKNHINQMIGRSLCLLEGEDLINQLKLMTNPEDKSTYILAIDNSGLLHTKRFKFDYKKKSITEHETKRFSCTIDASDNSVWSLDCYYPYIAVGGNHRCVLIHNIQDKPEIGENKIFKNIPYSENKHNVPYVSFSPRGEYIACASIDSQVKVWDTFSGKLLKKISNKTKQWGWGAKLIEKELFSLSTKNSNYSHTTSVFNNIINHILGIADDDTREVIDTQTLSGFLTDNKIDYFILSTHKDCLFINSIYSKEEEEGTSLRQVNLGKINLVRNYLQNSITMTNISYTDIMNMKYHFEYSRYEFIFVSKSLNVLVVGNRQGDIHFYDMEIKIYEEEGKVAIKEEPIAIIDCNYRIAGLRVVDHFNKSEPTKSCCEIFILKVNRILESIILKN